MEKTKKFGITVSFTIDSDIELAPAARAYLEELVIKITELARTQAPAATQTLISRQEYEP